MRLILIISGYAISSCALPAQYIPPALKADRRNPAHWPRGPSSRLSLLMEEHRDLIICCRSFKEFGYERLNLPDSKL